MDTTRGRSRAFVEWTVAVALLVGALATGLSMLVQLERVVPVTPVSAREPGVQHAPAAPAAVPPRAVSVPVLSLQGDVRIRVGEVAAEVFARIEGLAIAGADAVERRAGGERITREFVHAGGRFHLVTESGQAGSAPRVTAIFVP